MESEYFEILDFVIDNGRVELDEEGETDLDSLRVEIEFEASERGLSDSEIEEAVEYAMEHIS